jgi:hypothetical protein
MKKVLVILALFVAMLGTNASAFFLQVTTPSQYTDNTAIEPTIGVFLDAWVDGAPLATMFPTTPSATKIPLIDNTFGTSHTYRVRTHLSDGRLSADYTATLSTPLDDRIPKLPAAPLSIVK